jgi:hypothetical protein
MIAIDVPAFINYRSKVHLVTHGGRLVKKLAALRSGELPSDLGALVRMEYSTPNAAKSAANESTRRRDKL